MKTNSENLAVLKFAADAHAKVNHFYDGKHYVHHLDDVALVAGNFMHLIPEEDRDIVFQACYCHDLIEDTRLTYNDVKNGIIDILREDGSLVYHITEHARQVAEIVYALTNEKGRMRKERANTKYYQGIRATKYAVFVKLCDRIANTQYSKSQGSRMFEMYKKEQPGFKMSLQDDNSVKLYGSMFDHLDKIFYE